MICFLCSSEISLNNCGVRVSLTKIFESLEVGGNWEKFDKFCCKKCAVITKRFTNLLEDMEKIRLELKIKVGQFGQLITLVNNVEQINPTAERDHCNNDDEYLKQMAKEKSLKTFMDQMQPIISLRRLDAGIIETLRGKRLETNLPTCSSTSGSIGDIRPSACSSTMETRTEDQQPEPGNSNGENVHNQQNKRINKKFFQKKVEKAKTSVTPKKKQQRSIPKNVKRGACSRNRIGPKSLKATNGVILTPQAQTELLEAAKEHVKSLATQWKKQLAESENGSKKVQECRQNLTKKKRKYVRRKKGEDLGKRPNNQQPNASLNTPVSSNIQKINKTVNSAAETRKSLKRKMCVYSSDDEDDDEEESNPAVSETNNIVNEELVQGRGSSVQLDSSDDNFETTSVFASYDNPSKQEMMSYISSTSS